MKTALAPAALAILALLTASSAHATAGFDCTIEDGNIAFAASGHGPRGIPAPVQGFDGTLTVKLPWAAEKLKSIPLNTNLMQSWWEGGELKLLVYKETEGNDPFASVKLVVNTKLADDEDGYAGDYELTVQVPEKTETFTGKVTCSGE